jgi:hypothetical protein
MFQKNFGSGACMVSSGHLVASRAKILIAHGVFDLCWIICWSSAADES